MLKRLALLLALAFVFAGCGDDEGGGGTDTMGTDTMGGGDQTGTDSNTTGTDTNTTGTDTNTTGNDTNTTGNDTNTTGNDTTTSDTTGQSLCDLLGASATVGTACTGPNDTACDANSVCLQVPPATGASCLQVCSPNNCPTCAGGKVCLTLVDETSAPITLDDGTIVGACADQPTGNAGAYDECDGGTVLCQAGLDCVGLTSGGKGSCLPKCTGQNDTSCPTRESVAGQCALQTSAGFNCGLICDPATPTCPTGMTCTAISGGGICWPS